MKTKSDRDWAVDSVRGIAADLAETSSLDWPECTRHLDSYEDWAWACEILGEERALAIAQDAHYLARCAQGEFALRERRITALLKLAAAGPGGVLVEHEGRLVVEYAPALEIYRPGSFRRITDYAALEGAGVIDDDGDKEYAAIVEYADMAVEW